MNITISDELSSEEEEEAPKTKDSRKPINPLNEISLEDQPLFVDLTGREPDGFSFESRQKTIEGPRNYEFPVDMGQCHCCTEHSQRSNYNNPWEEQGKYQVSKSDEKLVSG